MNLKIITDSSSDLTIEEGKQFGIEIVPLTLSFDDKIYRDGIDIQKEEFYDLLINQKKYPKTSQPSPECFVSLYEEAKEKGEIVLVLPIAKALSGTYNSAVIAKDIVGYDQIYIIDTCTTIAGLQIMVAEALEKSKTMDILAVVAHLEEFKKRIVLYACMNTLEYLSKGGRLTGVEAALGNFLNLKPIITFKEDGAIDIVSKSFGKVRANNSLVKLLQNNKMDTRYGVFYYYSYVEENLNHFIDRLKKENLYVEGHRINLSPVVGCHIGDNAYGIVYVKAQKQC